jgi:hypothetical protein
LSLVCVPAAARERRLDLHCSNKHACPLFLFLFLFCPLFLFAFADAEVAATLGLSGDQKLRVRTALDDATLGRRNIYARVRDPGDADHDANDLTERTGKNILGMLTPSQQEAWRQMTGEPFRSRIGFMPNDSFEFPERVGPGPLPPHDWARTSDDHGPPGPPPGGWRGKKDGLPPDDGPFPPKKKKN